MKYLMLIYGNQEKWRRSDREPVELWPILLQCV
jgi:hypothetical protein